jgi:hypothetical protein
LRLFLALALSGSSESYVVAGALAGMLPQIRDDVDGLLVLDPTDDRIADRSTGATCSAQCHLARDSTARVCVRVRWPAVRNSAAARGDATRPRTPQELAQFDAIVDALALAERALSVGKSTNVSV